MSKQITDALAVIKAATGLDAACDPNIQDYLREFRIGQMIYDARTQAGLTQKQLADLIGTKQPVISQLEDADYDGHSLTMLDRIAKALNQKVEIRFVSAEEETAAN